MKWNTAHAISAVVALALTAALAGQAHASCGKSNRIQHFNSNCLEGRHDNNGMWKDNTAEARSDCWEYGTVVAKLDLKSWPDKTWYLKNNDKKKWKGSAHINSLQCCTDLSDLCNVSDVVNEDSCVERFAESSAGATCDPPDVEVVSSDRYCKFTTYCDGRTDDDTVFTVKWLEVDLLQSCDGVLRKGSC